MKSGSAIRIFIGLYLLVFFGYLLGPLIIMSITAFNSPPFPKAAPWECLTFEWFGVLAQDGRILNGIKNSFIIGAGTVVLSVLLGMAGALVLTQVWPKLRATYYTIVIAPILIPGVVLGISTLVFWDRVGTMIGLSDESLFHNGIFLTMLGQATFISSYCMLVFVARLQRFDTAQTEAALDLGATHAQAFRKVMLPFLRPAIGSAAVLAFLASFENYNTTTFTFGKFPTLTIELAQKVRYGINPSISSLAVIIVGLTVVGALAYEVWKRRQQLAIANGAPVAAVSGGIRMPKIFSGNPAAIILLMLVVSGVGTIFYAQAYSPQQCKIEVKEEKQRGIQERIRALKEKQEKQRLQEKLKGPDIFNKEKKKDGVFDPKNLDSEKKEEDAKGKNPGKGTFGDVFKPGNLDDEKKKSE